MSKEIVPQQVLASKIFLIRGHKVMLDQDLAKLYGVETKALNRAIKRNVERFPEDFMFKLTRLEYTEILRCQIGTLRHGRHSKLDITNCDFQLWLEVPNWNLKMAGMRGPAGKL